MARKVVTPAKSFEVSTGNRKEEPNQVVGTSPEGKTLVKLATETAAEVASEEELIVGAFWALLSRVGYTVW